MLGGRNLSLFPKLNFSQLYTLTLKKTNDTTFFSYLDVDLLPVTPFSLV